LEIKTNIQKFTKPLYLESGRILEPWQIIYEMANLMKTKTM